MTGRRQADPAGQAPEVTDQEGGAQAQRLDRWLWFTRAVKSRTLAAAQIEAGKIRVNAVKVTKPSYNVKPGDVITSAANKDVRILQVKALGVRRGPATEAQLLYEDKTPQPMVRDSSEAASLLVQGSGRREAGSGRPTKRDRRQLERLQGRE